MKLRFENLGAIKQLEIDLCKKLTVFCGPNGTGKTYAAYAVYGFIKLLLVGDPIFKLNELIEKKKIEVSLNFESIYKKEQFYANFFKTWIQEVFGTKSLDFFNSFNTDLITTKEEFVSSAKALSFDFSYLYENVLIKYKKKSNSNKMSVSLPESVSLNTITELTEVYHLAIITKYILNNTLLNSYILPVERNSVYTFISELTLNKIDEKQLSGKENKKDRYPLPIRDAISVAGDLATIKKSESEYKYLAEEIERIILHGKVSVSEDGEMQFTSDKANEKILPIHLTASIIKNISGLLIYLKHQAKRNDLLIIDEPELGLHPDNQILITRIFGKLIKKGIRILVCTHSDYIIRELNNLIILSSKKGEIKKKAQEFGYEMDELIYPSDVGAYLFDFNSDNNNLVSVEKLLVDKSGFEVKTIDKAISELNNRSMDLFFALKEEE